MIRWRSGIVQSRRRQWHGAVELDVVLADDAVVRALAYPQMVGEPQEGDRVLLNANALALGLGTGGYALVVALPDRLPSDQDAPGHIVKARYTPLQVVGLAVDEEASPHRTVMQRASTLEGMPVITADLHSALPAILAGIDFKYKVAYVMTDGAALAAGFSRSLDALRDRLVGTITTGQSFGGDLEAVNVHSGLLAAKHVLGADIAIVSQGPGNLGTGTAWGFTGVSVGEAINAAGTLEGRPIGSLRMSEADGRERHRGLSHHSLTAYSKVALLRADLVVPANLNAHLLAQVKPLAERHNIVTVPIDGLDAALRAAPVKLSTMGRGLDDDYLYFLTAAVAGRHASSLIGGGSQAL